MINKNANALPWWTWLMPFFIFYIGTQVSMYFKVPAGSELFYLPIPLGLILVHWWGLRVLPGLFINSIVTTVIWGDADFTWQALMMTHETFCVFVSWYLFSYKFKGKAWLPDIKNTGYFVVLGIMIPVTINGIYVFWLSAHSNLWIHTAMVWTADFASSFSLALPALFFLTPVMEVLGLTKQTGSKYIRPSVSYRLLRPNLPEIVFSIICLSILTFIIPLEKYWFVYGIFTLYISVRFGFNNAILANLLVFTLTYIIPFLTSGFRDSSWVLESNLINVHLGMSMLSVTACITGRVISDLKETEQKLHKQYLELEKTNKELDRFVYSASHDLSAPLKSLLGLIHISRIDGDPTHHMSYINKMETSIHRLEGFISEILDYSKNSRSLILSDAVKITELIDEIKNNLTLMENFDKIKIDTTGIHKNILYADRMRLKIILNNLLSNAVKYHRFHEGHQPRIVISSEEIQELIQIKITDNGQGIHPEHLDKVFNMFYRGTFSSTGSGLGLYIAKQAVEKMNGRIEVVSALGEGSTFTVFLPKEI